MIQLKAATYQLKDYDKDGTVIIQVNAFNVEDSQGDISLKGSFSKSINDGFSRWRYLYNHDRAEKICEPLEAWEDSNGLIVKAVLNLNKPLGQNTYQDYKLAAEYGRSVEHSAAVAAIKSKGSSPRYVTEGMLQEFSYIPVWGANPETPLLALKTADEDFLQFCITKGDYTECMINKLETLYKALTEPGDHSDDAARLSRFTDNLNF